MGVYSKAGIEGVGPQLYMYEDDCCLSNDIELISIVQLKPGRLEFSGAVQLEQSPRHQNLMGHPLKWTLDLNRPCKGR